MGRTSLVKPSANPAELIDRLMAAPLPVEEPWMDEDERAEVRRALEQRARKIVEAKDALRKHAKAERKAAASAVSRAGEALAATFFDEGPKLPPGAVVAGYWPVNHEMDSRPLMGALAERAHVLALPVVETKNRPLTFRRWRAGDALAAGVFGVPEPGPAAPALMPQVVLVPLLAFDAHGFRLGYGGGYYDRTLSELRGAAGVVAIGLAFERQGVERLIVEPHDVPLDWIVTEKRALSFGR